MRRRRARKRALTPDRQATGPAASVSARHGIPRHCRPDTPGNSATAAEFSGHESNRAPRQFTWLPASGTVWLCRRTIRRPLW